jgi:hypothetical protein
MYLIGKKITSVRPMLDEEYKNVGWSIPDRNDEVSVIIELDDGTLLYPSCDGEGNNGGIVFGQYPNSGRQFRILKDDFDEVKIREIF